MATPVSTNKWAGVFDCSICRRKRLTGSEFSKKALERYRKTGASLKCKNCVAEGEAKERRAAAMRAGVDANRVGTNEEETRKCASCAQVLSRGAFNNNQWNKGEEKSRCRECVAMSIEKEELQSKALAKAKVEEAKKRVEKAEATGNVQQKLRALTELAAIEAETVTGLKPRAGRNRRSRR